MCILFHDVMLNCLADCGEFTHVSCHVISALVMGTDFSRDKKSHRDRISGMFENHLLQEVFPH